MSKYESWQEFILNSPLYTCQERQVSQIGDVIYHLWDPPRIDGYCLHCEREVSWFPPGDATTHIGDPRKIEGLWTVLYRCVRDTSHRMQFNFLVTESEYVKVGQFPSLADISLPEIKKYSKLLGPYYAELGRAIGLAAHGVGVGSFIYLRRIFEWLVEEAHVHAKANSNWDETKYKDSRMVEKIVLLRSYLPPFLVEHRNMYGILSKHVHELSENECRDNFEVVLMAIEMVLEQKLEQQERLNRENKVKRAIMDLQKKLGDPPLTS